MADRSSTIALNIKANTDKALQQFKSFSSSLQNKFLISGLQLDYVRNSLSSINREFERYVGGGGLTDAVQTQQLTRSLQTSLSLVQGYSSKVGRVMADNIGLALSKINVQLGGNKEDIVSFTNDISTAINQQVALGLTGTKSLVAANSQMYSLMQRIKLGYGVSVQEQSPLFKQFLLNKLSYDELLENVSGPLQNILRTAAFQSGGMVGNMSGLNRGLMLQNVGKILDTQGIPSAEELAKTNPEAIIGKLTNFLFDDRVGVFGTLRKIKLPGGETTTILEEGTRLLNAIFGENGFILQLTKSISKELGFGEGPDGPAKGIVALIRWVTDLVKGFTSALKEGGLEGLIDKFLDVIDKIIESLPVDKLANTLSKIITKFGTILGKALEKVPKTVSDLITKTVTVIIKGTWQSLTGQGPSDKEGDSTSPGGDKKSAFNVFRAALLGLGAIGLGAGGLGAFTLFKRREDTKNIEGTKERIQEYKDITDNLKDQKELQQRRKKQLTDQIKELKEQEASEEQITELKKQRKSVETEINEIDTQISSSKKSIRTSEKEIAGIKKQAILREKILLRRALMGSSAITGITTAATSIASGESWQRALIKGLTVGGGGALGSLAGPAGTVVGLALGEIFQDKVADFFGATKYNGNFPTAANGLFGAMSKESLMSGNKGLVIANQDEIIAPAHRMGQLAGMVSNMMGANRPQYELNEKFNRYQELQRKQMVELIKETKIGNDIKKEQKSNAMTPSNVTNNVTNANIDGKSFAQAAPTGFWDSISNFFKGIVNNLPQPIKDLFGIKTQLAGGNITSSFMQLYKSEMNAYGGKPVLANDKELIISPRNYSTFASLLRNSGGMGSSAKIENNISINIDSSNSMDPNKIAKEVMKAIDNKYSQTYKSLTYV